MKITQKPEGVTETVLEENVINVQKSHSLPMDGYTGEGPKPRRRRRIFRGDATAQHQPPPRRQNVIGREGWKPKLSEEEIFKAANHHGEYVRGSITLTDLPKFDSPTEYGINEDEEKRLLRLEVSRLVKDTASSEPLLFNSEGVFGLTTPKAFNAVSDLADQILCSLAIITYDNQLLLFEHYHSVSGLQVAAALFRSASSTLRRKFQQNEKVKPRAPKMIEPASANQTAYFALVDYITSSVGRLLLRSATSQYWINHTLAVLAKWALKLKALSYDQTANATQALANGEAIIEELNASNDSGRIPSKISPASETGRPFYAMDDYMANLRMLRIHVSKRDNAGESDLQVHEEIDATQIYFGDSAMLRYYMYTVFKAAVFSIYSHNSYHNEPSTFEVCSLVYETGLGRSLTVLSADREGDVYVSSESANVNCSYTALKLLLRNLEELQSQQRPRQSTQSGREQTLIRWQWMEDRAATTSVKGQLRTAETDDLVSALVPLSLASPFVTERIRQMITAVAVNSEEEDPVLQFEHKYFQAKYTVSTAEYLSRQSGPRSPSQQVYNDPEVAPVSGNILTRRIRAGTKLDLYGLEMSNPEGEVSLIDNSKQSNNLKLYQKEEKRMRDWIFAETSVTVTCRGYVMSILALCVTIICGAIAIPFAVRDRITGVDPFQITTFAWLIMGFILIVAKSRYVTYWPWHDFLHGQVVCNSVSDLADVTGVDPQLVIMKLLHNERKTTLVTRGPYNGMFTRKELFMGGFSIDVPARTSTLFASGFIILKVLSQDGEHLISLDVRKGAQLAYASKNSLATRYLSCLDLGSQDLDEDEADTSHSQTGSSRVLYLLENELSYNKVLGLYCYDSCFG